VKSLVDIFDHQRRLRPGAPAIAATEGAAYSYSQVGLMSDEIARRIRSAGGRPGEAVGLSMRRSPMAVVSVLGILRAGCCYVPIDPKYPQERRSYVAEDVGLRLLVRDDELRGDKLAAITALSPKTQQKSLPADAAYIIYTSGSTGQPKGVVVGHSQVMALFRAATLVYSFAPSDVWTLFHSLSFDFSVWEIWGAFSTGGCLVVLDEDTVLDPELFLDAMRRHRVTIVNQVPSAFEGLLGAVIDNGQSLPDLRYIIFGGDRIAPHSIRQWWQHVDAPHCDIHNMYGITETTVHVTDVALTDEVLASASAGSTPIGRPLSHLKLRLGANDADEGEIEVAGLGLSYGYLGRHKLTKERFALDQQTRQIWYRSGDYAYNVDGNLYYGGRQDDQVKVRGYRVGLNEVEHYLASHEAVKAAACTCEEDVGGGQLTGWLEFESSVHFESEMSFRASLRELLPAHMVPRKLVRVSKMPLTSNGKVDRSALPGVARPWPQGRS